MKYLCLIAIAFLVACGSRNCGADGNDAPSAGADLVSLGHACLWVGGGAVVVGLILRLIVGVALGILVAEGGGVAIACGLAFTWLGQHLVLLVCACVLAGLAWAYHRRVYLIGWAQRWLGLKKPAQVSP